MSQHTASVPVAREQDLAIAQAERPRRFNLTSIWVMTVLLVFMLYFLIPFFWLVISATKSQADLFGTFGLWFAPNFNLFTNLEQLFTYNNGIYCALAAQYACCMRGWAAWWAPFLRPWPAMRWPNMSSVGAT